MPAWVVWIIVACVLGVGEVFTLSFFLAPFAAGAVLGAGVAALGLGVELQLVVFLAASVALLGLLRPVARAHRGTPGALRTGTAALVGAPAVVLARVDHDAGRVRIAGDEWTARAFDEDDVLEPGARVQVMEIRGATALVSP